MGISPEITKLREGDEQTYRETVNRYRDRVYNTALGIIQHHENAQDITQDVFLEVFRSVSRFRGDCSLSTWIYRITAQKSLEHLRTNKRLKRSATPLSLFGR